MNSLKNGSLLLEKFYKIDNVGTSHRENDAIMVNVMDEITSAKKKFFCQEKKKALRKALKEEYASLLKGMKKLIRKQESIVSRIDSEVKAEEMMDVLFSLRKEMDDYTERLIEWDYLYSDKIFSEQEYTVVKWVCLYDNIDKYNKKIEEYEFVNIKIDTGRNYLKNWKTYFYLWICMEKQNNSRQMFMLDYKKRKEDIAAEDLVKSKNKLCAMDFHGQLSKSVYTQRKKLNLTQMELAQRSGVDRSMIAKIERLYQPTTVETAVKLVSALDMGIAIYPLNEPFAKDNTIKVTSRGGT